MRDEQQPLRRIFSRRAWHGPSAEFPAHLENAFRERYNEVNAPLAHSGLLMGVFILLAFYFWDIVIDVAQSTKTLMIRIAGAILMLAVIYLPGQFGVRYFQQFFAFTIATVGLGVILIIAIVKDGLNVGLSGVMIVLTFNFGFLRLLFFPSLIAGAAICAGYNLAAAAAGMETARIVANNFFLVSTFVAGAAVTYRLERLTRDQFLAERELLGRQD
jgi:hypothetical protein